MPTGSCLCKQIRVSYTGEPAFKAMCHCTDCRKRPGGGIVYQIPEGQFKVEAGTPKEYDHTTDYDRILKHHFCGNCGTLMYCTGGAPQVAGMV